MTITRNMKPYTINTFDSTITGLTATPPLRCIASATENTYEVRTRTYEDVPSTVIQHQKKPDANSITTSGVRDNGRCIRALGKEAASP